jgi:hypothetical protein
MKSPLHILHLEDDQNDAELIQDALEKDGIISTITRVQTRDNFVSALDGGPHRPNLFGFCLTRV